MYGQVQNLFILNQQGTLIIFPGFLEHEYAVDFGIEPFRFIHWNIQAVPKEWQKMFKKKKYTVIKQAISKDLAAFIANYFCMQKQVYTNKQDTFHHLKTYRIIMKVKMNRFQILILNTEILLWKHYC